jgi:predicted AAA+ superfamily ATPase
MNRWFTKEFGGFPQVVLAEDYEQKKIHLKDIFKSYFEKEVEKLADFGKINAFRDLMLLLMQSAGSKISISKLSSEIGITRETIYSYISFLQGTYFIFLIPPYVKSIDREVSGSKKVYICDNGFLSQFGRISEGSLFENAVFNNLKKYGDLKYYQRRSGVEIDFVIPDKKVCLEVKSKGIARISHKGSFTRQRKCQRKAKLEVEISEAYLTVC